MPRYAASTAAKSRRQNGGILSPTNNHGRVLGDPGAIFSTKRPPSEGSSVVPSGKAQHHRTPLAPQPHRCWLGASLVGAAVSAPVIVDLGVHDPFVNSHAQERGEVNVGGALVQPYPYAILIQRHGERV